MSQPMFSGDLAFLSNFDTTPFWHPVLGDLASGEHGFNALKTMNLKQRDHVLAASTPSEAKRRGRRVTLRPDWDTGARVWAMHSVLDAKFQSSPLWDWLAATQGRLVETNYWHDQFWGDCYCPKHANIPGVNMLGELLMAIRASS